MTKQINVGSEINRTFGKKVEIWRITRIELDDKFKLAIYACKEKHFDYETVEGKKLLKQKSYDHDELILSYDNKN